MDKAFFALPNFEAWTFVINILFLNYSYDIEKNITRNLTDKQHFNQIDYILVSRHWKSPALNSCSYHALKLVVVMDYDWAARVA